MRHRFGEDEPLNLERHLGEGGETVHARVAVAAHHHGPSPQAFLHIGFAPPLVVPEGMIEVHPHRRRRHALGLVIPSISREIIGEERVFGPRHARAGIHLQNHLVAAVAVFGAGRNQKQIADVGIPAPDEFLPVEWLPVVRVAAQALIFLEIGFLLESHHRARVVVSFGDVIGLVTAEWLVEIALHIIRVRMIVDGHAAALIGHRLGEVAVIEPDLQREEVGIGLVNVFAHHLHRALHDVLAGHVQHRRRADIHQDAQLDARQFVPRHVF